jgi:hypothetical protein
MVSDCGNRRDQFGRGMKLIFSFRRREKIEARSAGRLCLLAYSELEPHRRLKMRCGTKIPDFEQAMSQALGENNIF